MAQSVKHLPTVQETRVRALGGEYPLEKEMATHSSVLAWRSHGQRAWWAIVHGWQRVRHTEWVTHTQAVSVRIFFFFLIHWFWAVLGLHCFGFSLVAVSEDYSLVAVRSFLLWWLLTRVRQYLWYMASAAAAQRAGSVVVAHRLRCSTVSGIISDQGLNPCLLHWQADSLPLSHKGSPRLWLKKKKRKEK